jgi:phage baseplate assembly protein gpV
MTRRTASNINALRLRSDWLMVSNRDRQYVRHFSAPTANKLDGVITVCPAGVASVPEWMQ